MARQCGSCSLCCKLLPVSSIHKPGFTHCKFQRAKGCTIYSARPLSCRLWSCQWLRNEDNRADDLRRPDRARYVIDMLPDYIIVQDNDTKAELKVRIEQIWVDPAFPDAHRDPALRDYLESFPRPGLCRIGPGAGLVIYPPSLSSDRQWHEVQSTQASEVEHSAEEIFNLIETGAI